MHHAYSISVQHELLPSRRGLLTSADGGGGAVSMTDPRNGGDRRLPSAWREEQNVARQAAFLCDLPWLLAQCQLQKGDLAAAVRMGNGRGVLGVVHCAPYGPPRLKLRAVPRVSQICTWKVRMSGGDFPQLQCPKSWQCVLCFHICLPSFLLSISCLHAARLLMQQ